MGLATFLVLFTATSALATPFPTGAGTHSTSYRADGDLELRYAIEIPPRLAAGEGLPLVLALHYGFDTSAPFPPFYGRGFLESVVSPGLRDLGAIIVAPDSHGKSWSDPEVSAAVMALVEALKQRYPIDAQRVLVTGYSMGGHGTWWFLAHHGDAFTAAVPMASFVREATLAKVQGTPILALHSPADELVSIAPVRDAIATLAKRGEDAVLHEVEGISHYRSPRFADILREQVVPWLRVLWRQQPVD